MIVAGTVLTSHWITNALARVEEEKARSEDLAVQSNKMAALGKMAAGILPITICLPVAEQAANS